MKKLTDLIQNEDLLNVLTEEQMETVKGGNGVVDLWE
mgnify:CR=1 FL=1